MGGMALLFMIALYVTARRLNTTITDSLRTRYDCQQAENSASYQARFDDLTELPNRRYLHEQTQRNLARSRRHGIGVLCHFWIWIISRPLMTHWAIQ